MVTGGDHQKEDAEKNSPSLTRGPTNKTSWGTPARSGGHSASSSGSPGSPSSRSEAAVTTPASENTSIRLNHLDIHGDDVGSPQGTVAGKKKKRGARAVSGDKSGRGLRQFSMKVCEKVQSKGRTTYNEVRCKAVSVDPLPSSGQPRKFISPDSGKYQLEFTTSPRKMWTPWEAWHKVADELVAEFADPGSSLASPDQQQYDEKNIRRRVYDALNVLMAMDIISKDKKEIQWKGLPRTSLNDIEELKAERVALRNRIEKKSAYLQELEEQYVGLQNLVERNEQLYNSGIAPSGGVALPFILVQTRPHATVEVEISEDMQLVHFDFNSTPFKLHDDTYVLKAMGFCERQNDDGTQQAIVNGGESSNSLSMYQPQTPTAAKPNESGKGPSPPPIPGILKARVKHEH
uniref:Transcription factor-like protein DPB n=1 Tax=Anthurium amnicola TaxID=1678845 RepID=A0A1D1Y1R9_9ARAE